MHRNLLKMLMRTSFPYSFIFNLFKMAVQYQFFRIDGLNFFPSQNTRPPVPNFRRDYIFIPTNVSVVCKYLSYWLYVIIPFNIHNNSLKSNISDHCPNFSIVRVRIWKLFFLFLNQNICCGYSKYWDSCETFFEHQKHMFRLMGKEVFAILCAHTILIWTYILIPCLTFFLSRGGSFKALIIKEAALGTTSILACLFCMVSLQVIFKPFQSPVFFWMSSPIFFGDWKTNIVTNNAFWRTNSLSVISYSTIVSCKKNSYKSVY